jgi:hypothetical protein
VVGDVGGGGVRRADQSLAGSWVQTSSWLARAATAVQGRYRVAEAVAVREEQESGARDCSISLAQSQRRRQRRLGCTRNGPVTRPGRRRLQRATRVSDVSLGRGDSERVFMELRETGGRCRATGTSCNSKRQPCMICCLALRAAAPA